jgi:pimeloyl-ACP methyl ester carboxylesterase
VERWTAIGKDLANKDRRVVFLIRPGYRSPAGDSSGWANPKDDDYTPQNIDRVAQALRVLRERYRAPQLLLVGHSGGAAASALVLGRHPGVADAALLLGCPCDVPRWRMHRSSQRGRDTTWRNSLNPLDAIGTIPAGTPVIAVTGAQDDNTLPEFARRWVAAAAARGLRARFEAAEGRDHDSILAWPEIPQRAAELIEALAR